MCMCDDLRYVMIPPLWLAMSHLTASRFFLVLKSTASPEACLESRPVPLTRAPGRQVEITWTFPMACSSRSRASAALAERHDRDAFVFASAMSIDPEIINTATSSLVKLDIVEQLVA